MKKLTGGSLVVSIISALIFTLAEQLDGSVDYEGISRVFNLLVSKHANLRGIR